LHQEKPVGSTFLSDQLLALELGVIDAGITPSIFLQERLGFHHVGTLPQIGFKFERWLDVVFHRRLLDTPAHPMDG